MCRPCLYTAHVYKDDVTLYLGSYYIYGDIPRDLDQKASDIGNDSTTAYLCTSPLKINHFTSVSHFDQSHAASASSLTVALYR
jgi:hypothetical protein